MYITFLKFEVLEQSACFHPRGKLCIYYNDIYNNNVTNYLQ